MSPNASIANSPALNVELDLEPGLESGAGSEFCSERLERVFTDCFSTSYNTRLVGGAAEPLYVPARPPQQCLVHYRDDFFASALHETAHWCIAGEARLQQPDFGYWYAADGRDADSQNAFEAVEAKPQALEWFFSRACGFAFQVSVDNLNPSNGEMPDSREFSERVLAAAVSWQAGGLPARATQFYTALSAEFNTQLAVDDLLFTLEDLQ